MVDLSILGKGLEIFQIVQRYVTILDGLAAANEDTKLHEENFVKAIKAVFGMGPGLTAAERAKDEALYLKHKATLHAPRPAPGD